MDVLEIYQQGETKFFITTYLRVDKLYYVDVPRGGNCPNSSKVPGVERETTAIGDDSFFGVCLFSSVDQYFPIDPEAITIVRRLTLLQHSNALSCVSRYSYTPTIPLL